MSNPTITLGPITDHGTLADRRALSVAVSYGFTRDGDIEVETVRCEFTGPAIGRGPVVVIGHSSQGSWQCNVVDPERFGDTFGPAWIRNFYRPAPIGTARLVAR